MSSKVETSELNNFVSSFAQDAVNKVYRNGYGVFLYSQGTDKKEGMRHAASLLDECFRQEDSSYVSNKRAVFSYLKSLESKLTRLKKKSLKLNWNSNRIQDFLLQPLKAPVSRKKQPLPSTRSVDDTVSGNFPQEDQLDGIQGTQDCFLPRVAQSQLEVPLPMKKLRTDCSQCNLIRKRFVTRCRFLENKVRRTKLNAKSLCRSPGTKVLNQTIKRKTARVETLKREKSALKMRVQHLERQLGATATKKEKVSLLSRRNRMQQKKINQLQQEVLMLKVIIIKQNMC